MKTNNGGGEQYLSQLVNMAIPVGFVLAHKGMAKLKSTKSGGGDDEAFTNRIQHVSYRIQQFLKRNPK